MSIRKIKYKGKVQTVKQWSIELGIPTKTIYQRLNLDWPPELVLSSKYFNYCDDLKAANKVEQREGYPTVMFDHSKDILCPPCCSEVDICVHAVPISPYNSSDPSEAHFYCKLLGIFVWGETPRC
jgi:hypothetical protein